MCLVWFLVSAVFLFNSTMGIPPELLLAKGKGKNFSKIPEDGGGTGTISLDPREIECFTSDGYFDPPLVEQGLISTFQTAGSQDCWRFCKVMSDCLGVQYNISDSLCSTFGFISNWKETRTSSEKGPPDLLVQFKRCSMPHRGLTLEKATEMSEDDKELVLLNANARKYSCLDVKKLVRDSTVTRVLRFDDCYNSDRWILRPVDGVNSSYQLFHISPSKHPNLVLNAVMINESRNLVKATLINRDISEEKKSESHIMFTSPTFIYGRENSYLISSYGLLQNGYGALSLQIGRGQQQQQLQQLSVQFFSTETFQQPQICLPSQFKRRNASVRLPKNQPFFLPGAPVEVHCAPGYGVKELNYTVSQTLVCSGKARPASCTEVPNSELIRYQRQRNALGVLVGVLLVIKMIILAVYEAGKLRETCPGPRMVE